MATKAKEVQETQEPQVVQDIPAAPGAEAIGSLGINPTTAEISAKQAAQSAYDKDQAEYQAQRDRHTSLVAAYNALPAKYNRTFLGLSVEYIHFTMKGETGTDIPADDLAVIEYAQAGDKLIAAATLCASGRF